MDDWWGWLLRYLHILSGVAMVGGVFLWGSLIMPAVQAHLPPHVGGAFLRVMFPRVSRYLTLLSGAAIVTGLLTLDALVGWRSMVSLFSGTTYGAILLASLVATLAMLLIGLRVIQPAGERLLRLSEGGAPPADEAARLSKRLAAGGITNFVLGLAVLGLMAAAVHVRVG